MIKKAIFIIALIFFIKIMISCRNPCGDPGICEISYNGVEVRALNTAGFTNVDVIDSVYKNAFGLSALMIQEETLIMDHPSINLLGFSTLKALSCEGPEFVYVDPLDYVQIMVTDTETEIMTDVTESFRVLSESNDYVSLDQFFREREDWNYHFQFELYDILEIPDSAIFTVQAYLESGEVLASDTKQINFKN